MYCVKDLGELLFNFNNDFEEVYLVFLFYLMIKELIIEEKWCIVKR